MRLLITTPTSIIVDVPDATSIRAEDESGSFGILQGHADFLTVLAISILRWRQADAAQRYCAVRRGVLSVSGGREVMVATREAVIGTDLDRLEDAVLAGFREAAEEERGARAESLRLQMTAIRRIIHYLRPGGSSILDRDL
jgi:F-type H+-transporting ATPase subunit epsilon